MVQVTSRPIMLRRTPKNGTSVNIKGKFYDVFETEADFTAAPKTIGHEYLIHVSDPGFQPLYHLVGFFEPRRKQWSTRQAELGSGYIHEPGGHLWVAIDSGWQDVGNIKGEKGDPGDEGPEGCISRATEWASGIEYHNDHGQDTWPRFIDTVIVTHPIGSAIPFSIYQCKKTHNSANISYTNTEYWQELNNMAPIYTPLIMAQYAVLQFTQTNQLLVTDNGEVIAGMGGGNYPIWAGGSSPSDPRTKFRVSKDGTVETKNAKLDGYMYSRFIPVEESDAQELGESVATRNIEYLLDSNLYLDATNHGVVLPVRPEYEGARVLILDSQFYKPRVNTPPTTVRTENGSPIVSGIFSRTTEGHSPTNWRANNVTIDAGTIELCLLSMPAPEGTRQLQWVMINNSCQRLSWDYDNHHYDLIR